MQQKKLTRFTKFVFVVVYFDTFR